MCQKCVSKACNDFAFHAFTFSARNMIGFWSFTQCGIFWSWQKLANRSARIIDVTQDFGNDLSLAAYMQLPVEQYYELDPAMIRPLGGMRFALQVPRVNVGILLHFWRAHMLHCLHILTGVGQAQQSLHFTWIRMTSEAACRADIGLCLQLFNVWVEPLVEVVVHLSTNRDAVVIEVCAITWETKSASAHLVAMSNSACSTAWHNLPT